MSTTVSGTLRRVTVTGVLLPFTAYYRLSRALQPVTAGCWTLGRSHCARRQGRGRGRGGWCGCLFHRATVALISAVHTFPFFEGCVCTSQHHDRGKSQALRRRKPVLPKIPRPIQYDSAEWEPAFLRQARDFPFFPLLPREASKRVPIFDRGTGTKLQGSDTAAWSRA